MLSYDAGDALWLMESQVLLEGLLVARVVYYQIPGGYVVEGGGWGDRNTLEVVMAGLQNTYKGIRESAIHKALDEKGIARVNWQCHMRKRYGKDRVPSHQYRPGVSLD